MKTAVLLAAAAILPFGGFAASITIFNTGVDALGNPLTPGTIDPHYVDTNINNVVQAESQNGAWAPAGPTAMYISPSNATQGDGVYTLDYRTTFDLTGLDPTSVNITGIWSTDNFGNDILVNGNSTGNGNCCFNPFKGFTLLGSSGFFTSGINTLDFVWGNSGGPGGLAVEFTSATANALNTSVPEPASLGLFGIGLAGFALVRRRRSMQG